MSPVNMLEAKTNLSRLVEAVESGAETEIIIARAGRPAARLVPLAPPPVRRVRRFGLANGLYAVPEDFDAYNDEILSMFEASE